MASRKKASQHTLDKLRSDYDFVLYTDGSNSVDGSSGGCAMAVVNSDTAYYSVSIGERLGPYDLDKGNRTSSNQQELRGILIALRFLQTFGEKNRNYKFRVAIASDSEYSVRSITEWARGWQRNGWKLSTGGKAKNVKLLSATLNLLDSLGNANVEVDVLWVRGHAGVPGNEIVDSLATQARAAAEQQWKTTYKNKQPFVEVGTGQLYSCFDHPDNWDNFDQAFERNVVPTLEAWLQAYHDQATEGETEFESSLRGMFSGIESAEFRGGNDPLFESVAADAGSAGADSAEGEEFTSQIMLDLLHSLAHLQLQIVECSQPEKPAGLHKQLMTKANEFARKVHAYVLSL